MEYKNADYAPSLLRLILGLLFILPGLSKLMAPAGIIGMLGGMGFPAATFFGWLLLLAEIVFGVAILLGFRLEYTVWPMVLVLVVALFAVAVPNINAPMGTIGVMWHVLGIFGLISLFLTGPGKYAVKGN